MTWWHSVCGVGRDSMVWFGWVKVCWCSGDLGELQRTRGGADESRSWKRGSCACGSGA